MTGRGSAEASSHCLGCRPANTRWIEAFGRGGGRCSRPPTCKVMVRQQEGSRLAAQQAVHWQPEQRG
ncbi:hypothetical protein BHE74_00035743 [Ensete ventricosum]|nr:hypothetical protein GW17_00000613 [Ensete ventricosum]RWW57473.1 hypothetical protein BHE74_00035743 [Ensete ventricosum]